MGANNKLERTTLMSYRAELGSVLPIVGHIKLVHFTAQLVRNLEDSLHKKTSPITRKPFSHVMVARCLRTLGAVFADAQERGVVTSNPCREIARKRLAAEEKRSGRDKGRLLEIGKDIPSLDETRWIIEAADPAWKVLLMTAAFTGMRSSELRALRSDNVDFSAGEIRVKERADKYGVTSAPKSRAGNRKVPMPRRDFESANRPACNAAGLVTKAGNAKYTGMHAFWHFYASWCLGAEKDGRLQLPPKTVQTRLGHSTIATTMDRYGHLLPQGGNEAMDEAMDRLFGTHKPVAS